MRRVIISLSGVIFLSLALCFFSMNVANAGTTVLKFQSAYPKNGTQGSHYEFFAKKVNEYTNGEVEIKLFWPGQLVKTPEAWTAIKRGAIQGYAGAIQYFSGEMPEASGQFYYSWDNPLEAAEIYYDYGYIDVLREATAKHGIYYIAPVSCNNRSLLLKFPVHKMNDMKGRKIRGGGGGIEALTVQAWGAAPTSIAAAEQYMALQRGTIEGTIYPWYVLVDQNSFHEVVKYVILPAVSSPGIVDLIMSKTEYDKLSSKNKEFGGFPNTLYGLTKPYFEVGAGVENIFKVLSVYGIWRLSYPQHENFNRFGLLFTLWVDF